ncbi:MAG: head maturation protease, ClpP-related [Deltaproteobacteria bacterium]
MPTITTREPILLDPREEVLASLSSASFRVTVRNATDDDPAEVLMYGAVGDPFDGVDARGFSNFLRENRGNPVNVRINSPGGLAYDGITIHNALLSHDGPVYTTIEGMAGSAARIVAMAGAPVRMFENATLFIHRALALAVGNVDVMRATADFLVKLDDQIARTYGAKAGKPRAQFLTMMRGKVDGTALSAAEAQKLGLVDEVLSIRQSDRPDPAKAQAALDQELRQEGTTRLATLQAARARRLCERCDLHEV